MYACDDLCADGSLENDLFDEIDPLSHVFSDSSSVVTHALDPTLEFKTLSDTLNYVFLDNNKTFFMVVAFDLNEGQEDKLLDVLRENKR